MKQRKGQRICKKLYSIIMIGGKIMRNSLFYAMKLSLKEKHYEYEHLNVGNLL